ncbi:hypothetical protein GPX89_07700 [Nocardia sp. ET3-3]|uniref:Uncharacterized protein n=1 Tax=Nocardia terrae TaxID=2675851 RepID=A0A7K1US80_9NOCA|nr:hypothetical protein [Nocardia terrae]MVU77131.1 hypothetical protein [Nocardia terrae]
MTPPAHEAPREYRVATGFLGMCEHCGKAGFASRKTARKYARGRYPGSALHAYQCRFHSDDCWHVGHLAPEVVSGDVRAHLFYGRDGVGAHRHRCGTRRRPQGRP